MQATDTNVCSPKDQIAANVGGVAGYVVLVLVPRHVMVCIPGM